MFRLLLGYCILDLTNRPKVNYRTGKCKFWNVDLPQRIEEKRQKLDAEQSKPAYASLPDMPGVKESAPPWIEREPIFSLPTIMPDDPRMTKLDEFPFESNPGEEPSSVEPSDETKAQQETVETSRSSVVVSLIIIIGILFLLVNVCAFGGIYYQRDKLRVRERLFNNRFQCNGANTSSKTFDDDDDESVNDVYTKACGQEVMTMTRSGFDKNRPVAGNYDSVVLASVKPEAIGGKRLGKWAEITRQRSSCSTVTMDPHTRVKEWINTEIIQRYSPRILRRQRREEKKRQLVCAEDPLVLEQQSSSSAMVAEKAIAPLADDTKAEKFRNKVYISFNHFNYYCIRLKK